MFQQWHIMKNLIGCSYLLKHLVTVLYLWVIISIRVFHLPQGTGSLGWAVIGVVVLLLVLSVGVCMVPLLFVIGVSAGAWCMYPLLCKYEEVFL